MTPASPTTGQTVTANVTSHDAEGSPLTTSYQWTRNGTNIAGATSSTLNLATAGNGDRGDLIRVIATVNDGTVNSTPVTSSPVTVANTAPVATVALAPSSPGTAAIMTATATRSDADADAISLTYVWRVNGTTRRTQTTTALTDTFDLGVAGNGDAGDIVSVEVTPNDGTVDGTAVSAQQTVVNTPLTVYASDLFSRTLVNSWGSANTGGAYTTQGTVADFDTTGTTGTITLPTGAANRSAVLAAVSARDVDLSYRVALNKVPTGGSLWSYGLLRRINATNEYRASMRFAPGGGVYISASTVVNGAEVGIGTEVRVTALTATPGAFFRVRAEFTGANPTTIRMRAWADGGTEPTTWQYTATNSAAALQVAGGVGLRNYLGSGATNAPFVVTVDDLSATSTGGGTNTAPVVDTVTVTPASPTTGQTVTANVTSHDADGNPLTTSYQWTRNGTNIAGATSSTLNLATAGNGDRGDLIRVIATVNDGTVNSAPVTSNPVTVVNTAPVATVGLAPSSPTTTDTLTATATSSDADADAISLTYVWRVNGTVRRTANTTALTDTFDLSVAGNGDAGETVSVEVTPSDGTVNGTAANAQVTVAGTTTVFASDLFSRALTNTWGTANVGGAYTLQGTAADFDTNGATGSIVLGTGAANRSAVLASVLARDVDISYRVALDKVPTGGSLWSYGLLRRINATNEYRASMRFAPGGGVFISASTVINGAEVGIGSEVRVTALTATPGAFFRVRAQFSGANPTSIRMRAWADGTTEPTTWQYNVTNAAAALQVAGAVGLRSYLGSAATNAPITVTVDDLAAISIAGP